MGSRRPGHGQERPRVPRAMVFAVSVLSWLGLFVGGPVLVGRKGTNLGWRRGQPSILNRVGILPLGLGAAGLGWCLAVHYAPGETVPVSLVPESLIARGPYRYSRNPMYVCEQSVLLGWTIYFGSAGLAGCLSALVAAMRYAVGREERTLESRFGDSWRTYASQVPRWVGVTPPS